MSSSQCGSANPLVSAKRSQAIRLLFIICVYFYTVKFTKTRVPLLVKLRRNLLLLCEFLERLPVCLTVNVARDWLKGMGDAAIAQNFSIQYCMTLPIITM